VNYCAICGHHIDRHSVKNLGPGARCNAPLAGKNNRCRCKGFVSPKKKEEVKHGD
jgi:hypothetical protein